VTTDISEWAGGLASSASQRGKDVINGIVDGILNPETAISDQLTGEDSITSDFASWAGGIADDATQWGKDIINAILDGINEVIGGLQDRLDELQNLSSRVSVNTDGPGDQEIRTGPSQPGGSGSGRGVLFTDASAGDAQIDGRQLSESTGRYRADPFRRR